MNPFNINVFGCGVCLGAAWISMCSGAVNLALLEAIFALINVWAWSLS